MFLWITEKMIKFVSLFVPCFLNWIRIKCSRQSASPSSKCDTSEMTPFATLSKLNIIASTRESRLASTPPLSPYQSEPLDYLKCQGENVSALQTVVQGQVLVFFIEAGHYQTLPKALVFSVCTTNRKYYVGSKNSTDRQTAIGKCQVSCCALEY